MPDQKEIQKLTTPEIVKRAYSRQDQEEYWSLIGILHLRGTGVEFEIADKLSRSPDPLERKMGADILGQLGGAERHFQKEAVTRLMELLRDPMDEVTAAAAYSLGHRNDSTAVAELLKLLDHPNGLVRHAVTVGLNCHEDPEAIAGLIRLSKDDHEDVRNWATFGLGSQIDADSPEIRQALLTRLDDQNEEIRGEALVGLARRQHPEVEEFIARELQGPTLNILVVEAAEIAAHPRLHPLLSKWKNTGTNEVDLFFEQRLDDALNACRPV